MEKKKFLKFMGIAFVISIVLELFVFNFRFFTTLTNDEEVFGPENLLYGSGLKYEPDNKWTNDDGELRPTILVTDKDSAEISINDINAKVDNIYIDLENVKRKSYAYKKTTYKIWATDEANKLYFSLPERDVVRDVERTKYINLSLSGESEKLKVKIKANENDRFIINEIRINANYPMFFSIIRVLVVFLIIMAVYIVRPKSPFYKHILNLKSKRQKLVLGIIIFVHISGFIGVSVLNPKFVFMGIEHHLQYSQLTDSLLEGHVYLDKEPSQTLLDMDNPYDSNYRKQLMKENKDTYLWDRAYYNGKYYVYFGIVPVLTYYLPFKLITGLDFPNFMGVLVTACIFIFAVLGLIHRIIQRWFKNVPFITYVLLSFFFIDSCGIMYFLKRPDFYSIPIIMGLTFSVAGLYFWLSSMKYKRVKHTEGEKADIKDYKKIDMDIPENEINTNNEEFQGFSGCRLFFGSLCMALVAGCRPQLLLGSFFAIFLFWNIVFKDRMLFSKKSIKYTILFVLPYVIVAIGLMYYNYIRFDSVFDFGANYNLTTNDMTRRGIVLGRTPLGIFSYLFQPPAYSPRFPFISDVWFYTNYMGVTIHEYLFGGILFNHFLLCINLFVFKFKNTLKLKGLFGFTVASIVFSVIIVVADTQLAGLLQRYMTDFAWLMFISGIILILTLLERVNDYLKKHIYTILLIGLAFSFYYDFATIFFYGDNALCNENPTIHYAVAYLIQFWL